MESSNSEEGFTVFQAVPFIATSIQYGNCKRALKFKLYVRVSYRGKSWGTIDTTENPRHPSLWEDFGGYQHKQEVKNAGLSMVTICTYGPV